MTLEKGIKRGKEQWPILFLSLCPTKSFLYNLVNWVFLFLGYLHYFLFFKLSSMSNYNNFDGTDTLILKMHSSYPCFEANTFWFEILFLVPGFIILAKILSS